jgi:hypothetical protein
MGRFRAEFHAQLRVRAFLADKTLVGTFTANLQTLPGARLIR